MFDIKHTILGTYLLKLLRKNETQKIKAIAQLKNIIQQIL